MSQLAWDQGVLGTWDLGFLSQANLGELVTPVLSFISKGTCEDKRNCLVLSNYARVIPGAELKWKVPVGGNSRG